MQGKYFIAAMFQLVIFFNAGAMLAPSEPKIGNFTGCKVSIVGKSEEEFKSTFNVVADLSQDKVVVLYGQDNPANPIAILYENSDDLNNLNLNVGWFLPGQKKAELYANNLSLYQIKQDSNGSGDLNVAALKDHITQQSGQRYPNPINIAQCGQERWPVNNNFNVIGLVSNQDKKKDNKEFLKSKTETSKVAPEGSTTTTTSSYSAKHMLFGVGVTFVAVLIAFLQYKGYVKIPYIS